MLWNTAIHHSCHREMAQDIDDILCNIDNTTFGEDDWNVVFDECSPLASKWQQLSAYLGLKLSIIDRIKNDFPSDSLGCWSEALKEWIRMNYNLQRYGEPSWKTLLKAIAKVDKLHFRMLADQHQASAITCRTREGNESEVHRFDSRPESNDTVICANLDAPELPTANFESASPTISLEQRGRVCSESQHMMYKFQELFTATRKSLWEEKVSVKELVHHLECLGSVKPAYKDAGQNPLRHQLPALAEAKNVDDVMSVVKDYSPFFNYRMLEHIISEFGTRKDKQNMAEYKDEFAKYAECCVVECPSEVSRMSEDGHSNLFVTLDDSFDNCTVSHLNIFINNLRKTLNISSHVHLKLCRICQGSLTLIFQLPIFVQQENFPLSREQEKALTDLGIVELSCGTYHFNGGENKEARGVRPTDSEEDSNSADSDAELSSMAAGLAVAKHGDTFSVSADSAIGRSSVITGTTAGVTQFSDDLVDREVCDLEMGMGHGVAGKNELHLASARGDLKKVKELTEKKKFDPLQKEAEFGKNALHYAAQFGQLGVLRYFFEERGCNTASQDNRAMTPLHYAAGGKHLDIVHYLVAEQQMDPLCCADDGTTPLHIASQAGDINIVRYLVNELSKFLSVKDIVTSRGIAGKAPIQFAAICGHLEIANYFITELNCDPNIASPVVYQGRTTGFGGRIALHGAAQGGHLHVIKYLVEQCNCNPSHLDNERATPLHIAAQKGHLKVVQYFTLEQHCDPLCTNKNNDTPLHNAAICGHLQVVKFFIEILCCPLDIRGWHNMTPLEQARRQGHRHVVNYLLLESIPPKLR